MHDCHRQQLISLTVLADLFLSFWAGGFAAFCVPKPVNTKRARPAPQMSGPVVNTHAVMAMGGGGGATEGTPPAALGVQPLAASENPFCSTRPGASPGQV